MSGGDLKFRAEQLATACGLAVVGAGVAFLILLRGPVTVVPRWVDRRIDKALAEQARDMRASS